MDAGLYISLPTEWSACPKEDSSIPVEIEGHQLDTMNTNRDGAFSMHSVWGSLLPSTTASSEVELRDDNVRGKVLSNIPTNWQEACALQNGRVRPRLEEWIFMRKISSTLERALTPHASGMPHRSTCSRMCVII